MTVILVLATFLVFIVVDYALNRRQVLATVPVAAPMQSRPRWAATMWTVSWFPNTFLIIPAIAGWCASAKT